MSEIESRDNAPEGAELNASSDAARTVAACACLPIARKSILIVEDDPQVCDLLEKLIITMGYFETGKARTAYEAYDLFRPGKFFAIILDLYLGQSIDEGMDLATTFREQDDNVYIAVMSGYEPPFDQRLLGSIDDFLQKPVDYKLLQSKLMMWSIQANRRLALKQYFDEKMIRYLNELARICEEQQEISEQIAEVAEMIQIK